MERVIAYVDGFNLYFGLKDKGWRRYYWLNIKNLCENILASNEILVLTKYYTSRVRGNPEKELRQSSYLSALQTVPDLVIREGRYKMTARNCNHCGAQDYVPTEKMTDVRIACEMITDAMLNKYDTALLVTGDGDLLPAIESVKEVASHKKIVIASPPKRNNDALVRAAGNHRPIFEKAIKNSLFPESIPLNNGYSLHCPDYWKT